MVLVMILIVAGFILGMSYLSVASIHAQVSHNYQSLARARYIAESGLEHAVFILRLSLEDLEGSDVTPLGPFYVDESSDSYTISAAEDSETPGLYTLTATATVGNARRTSSITACRTDAATTALEQGLLIDGPFVWMPWFLRVSGDVHVNGRMFNLAAVNGDASATNGLSGLLWRISGSKNGNAEEVPFPDINVNDYLEYSIGGAGCEAVEFTGRNFRSNNPLANGGAVTPGNPGGVVHLNPRRGNTVRLHNNLNFTGTLVINGNVQLYGRNITLNAVDGFPAIVAAGTIRVTNAARNVTINGTVAVDRGVIPWGSTYRSSTTINGAVVSDLFGYGAGLFGNHVLNYQPERAEIYNFSAESGSSTPQVTVLTWND